MFVTPVHVKCWWFKVDCASDPDQSKCEVDPTEKNPRAEEAIFLPDPTNEQTDRNWEKNQVKSEEQSRWQFQMGKIEICTALQRHDVYGNIEKDWLYNAQETNEGHRKYVHVRNHDTAILQLTSFGHFKKCCTR